MILGLLIVHKPDNLLSYMKDYQEVITQAKHYMHLFLVTEDAFPKLLTINKFITSALHYTNKDFPHYPNVEITDWISRIVRVHCCRIHAKYNNRYTPILHELETSGR